MLNNSKSSESTYSFRNFNLFPILSDTLSKLMISLYTHTHTHTHTYNLYIYLKYYLLPTLKLKHNLFNMI